MIFCRLQLIIPVAYFQFTKRTEFQILCIQIATIMPFPIWWSQLLGLNDLFDSLIASHNRVVTHFLLILVN